MIPIFGLKLDIFNRINEVFGYENTDLLLKKLADILTNYVGKNSIVGRLNTDKFAIIIEPIGDLKVEKLAQTILKNIQKGFWINNQEIFITASIGIACYPHDAKDIETLLRHCKQAIKHNKEEEIVMIFT